MLSQFALGHIEAAFQLSEQSDISDLAKVEIAYCRKLIALAKEQEYAKHMGAYAGAIGTKPSQSLMDGIAADCEQHGSN
jgi:hypothetical protein